MTLVTPVRMVTLDQEENKEQQDSVVLRARQETRSVVKIVAWRLQKSRPITTNDVNFCCDMIYLSTDS